MWKKKPLLLVLLPLALLSLSAAGIGSASPTVGLRKKKLFVFGDSYADTGNLARIISPAWNEPYGITFPQRPYGRFSDGRVFTDYVASTLGLKSPIPHKLRKAGKKLVPYGMNFAVGGSGVFDTLLVSVNLSCQIDAFAGEISAGTYSKEDIESSTAVIVIAGNDYLYYQDYLGGTLQGLKGLIPTVINQLKADMKRLLDMGVPKVAVANMHPIGCTPYILDLSASHTSCNGTVNQLVVDHNNLLDAAVMELNNNTIGRDNVVVIDLFNAFMSVIMQGDKKFTNVFQQCCMALSSDSRCGGVDSDGKKGYSLCDHPESSFYWDSVHPTQAGWIAIFSWLRSSLNCILN